MRGKNLGDKIFDWAWKILLIGTLGTVGTIVVKENIEYRNK